METGLENQYIIKNNKKMRLGYTTGSCAAGAAKAAAKMLFTGDKVGQVELMTPKGILLHLEILEQQLTQDKCCCAVRKDGGDDPDMTHGMLIYATVEKSHDQGIRIDGGTGVGRVTRRGLEQPVGEAAINRVPRAMIQREVQQVCEDSGYEGGLLVTISTPKGIEVGAKTFNPRLGIAGGISILGTSGIVEPMSEAALIKSIEIEMDMRLAHGAQYLLVTPGNYGAAYLREHMELPFEQSIKCSNYIGETLDMALNKGVKGILFVSHLGKFVKVASGIMNTHSRQADARVETLTASAIRAGADLDTARKILDCQTTDEALDVLAETPYLQESITQIVEHIHYYLNHHTYGQIMTGAVIFTNAHGYLGQTADAEQLISQIAYEFKQ